MIKLKNLLKEISDQDASIANLAAIGAEQVEDITFPFTSKKVSAGKGILSHEIITITPFDTVDRQSIIFQPYHLIFGESSLSIFDAFGVSETAGLSRKDCEEHLASLKKEGKSETWDGAFIAGLTNWSGPNYYCFFNVGRLLYPGYHNRILPHESLHLSRGLITIEANEYIRSNQGKDKWWEDERATFTSLVDDNEEYFAETLERCNAIAYDRWDKVKTKMQAPKKSASPVAPTVGNRSGIDITKGSNA